MNSVESISCPFCQSRSTQSFIKEIVPAYDLVKCVDCAVIYSLPFKSPGLDFYTKADDASSKERHSKLFSLPKDHPARKMPVLQEGSGKKLLDIGCGNGSFAEYAAGKGFNVLAIDIDTASLEIAAKRATKNTIYKNALLKDIIIDENQYNAFDVITMFEVFEHIDNPMETIKNIKKLLKPNGHFIGSLPNINRLSMWKRFNDYEAPPYHLSYWTINTWKSFMQKNDFQFIASKNNVYHGYIADYYRMRSKSEVMNVFWQIVKKIIEAPIERLINAGASFSFVFKKS